jgi:hypothetical protein
MAFKRAYNEAERAIAVEIVQRYGKLSNEAITDIRTTLSASTLSKSTIHGWLPPGLLHSHGQFELVRTSSNPEKRTRTPSPAAQDKASQALDDLFEEVARNYLSHANQESVIKEARGKDAIMAAAIAVDKMRLLRNLPTEIIDLLPSIQILFERMTARGLNPSEFVYRTLSRLEETNDPIH